MNYYLGIDGGGTKTKMYLIDENELVLSISEAGPTSIDTVNNEVIKNNLLEAFNKLFDKLPEDLMINKIFAGVGGIVTQEDSHYFMEIVKTLPHIKKNTAITVKNDMYNALYSGLMFDEGLALIVGTGTVAFGKSKENIHKCSGWGYKEGDPGSAYDLGIQAMHLLVKYVDGRILSSPFIEELKEVIGIHSTSDIVPIINSLWEERTKIASFAQVVTKHANLKDKYAIDIIDEATDELVLSVRGVYKNLSMNNHKIVIVGSLGNAKGYFRDSLIKKLKKMNRNVSIISPMVDPALGAALMAKNN
jgi:N-acetylglucosamine kinase-like BadF-type ATPase